MSALVKDFDPTSDDKEDQMPPPDPEFPSFLLAA